jgi:hypothetical protein
MNLYDAMRQHILNQSLAIQAGIAPTSPDMAEVAHKITLLQPKNPEALHAQIQMSGFSNLMRDMYGSMAKELEAPERMLSIFPAYAAEKRGLYLDYRMIITEMLCCDSLDLRNPRYFPMLQRIRDQFEYQIARTNRDYGIPEREYQAQSITTNTTRLEEIQRAPPIEKRKGLLSRFSIFGGR